MSLLDGFRKSAITKETPKNLLLNACVLYKNLKYDSAAKKWSGELLGATSGGTKFKVENEIVDIPVDGAIVKVRGLTQKQGESASIECNLIEVTTDMLKMSIVGANGVSDVEGYDLVTTKALIEDTDYFDNITAIGTLSDGKPIIIMMENALCTSGLEIETKNKENAVMKVVFECYAGFDGNHDTLPLKIYYPTRTTEVPETTPAMLQAKSSK